MWTAMPCSSKFSNSLILPKSRSIPRVDVLKMLHDIWFSCDISGNVLTYCQWWRESRGFGEEAELEGRTKGSWQCSLRQGGCQAGSAAPLGDMECWMEAAGGSCFSHKWGPSTFFKAWCFSPNWRATSTGTWVGCPCRWYSLLCKL